MNRRTFNQLAAGMAFGTLLPSCSTTSSRPRLLTDSYAGVKGQFIVTANRGHGKCLVRVVDWDTYSFSDFEIPLDLVHSIVQDKVDKQSLYFFEALGSAVQTNLRTGSISKVDHRKNKEMFNGHGTLSNDGDFIACSEFNSKPDSTVRLRSTKDLSIVGELPENYRSCHQVISLPNSTLLALGNTSGTRESVVFYDYEKKKIVGQVDTPHRVFHLMPISSSEIIGVCSNYENEPAPGANRFQTVREDVSSRENLTMFLSGLKASPAPLVYASIDGRLRTIFDEGKKDLLLGGFGITKAPEGRVLSTYTRSNKVLVWKNEKIDRVIEAPAPKNVQVSADGSEFLVLADGKIRIYSMASYELIKQFDGWPRITATSGYA